MLRTSMYVCLRFIIMEKISKELVGASTTPIILSLLASRDSYGYEIIQHVKKISQGIIEYKDGTLYPVLHKLEKKGFIESYWKIAENGRKRKYYRITKTGRQQLSTEQENWTLINQIISKLWQPNLI